MTDFQQRLQLQFPSPSKLLTPVVTTILVLMVIGFALVIYSRDFVLSQLAISQSCIFSGKIWQLVSYSMHNGGCGLAFNGLVVLFFGSSIEREWGTRTTLSLILFVTIVCGLFWFLINLVLGKNFVGIGTQPIAYGLVGTFGVLFRKQKFLVFLWTIEAQTIAWIFVIIGLVYCIAVPLNLIWVGGALVAYIFVKIRWFLQANQNKDGVSTLRSGDFVELD